MQVQGAVAVVTGGASGLGAGTVRRFVDLGGRAAILDLPGSAGADLADELGDAAMFAAADVRDSDQVEVALAAVVNEFGAIDVNLNAAGVANAHRVVTRDGDLFPLDLFRFVVDVNLIGTFDVARRCAAHMAANEPNEDGERGVIVNVASIAAFEGQVGQAAYAASKGGIAAMTLPLARDLASIGVRVNTIAPGIMDTPMLAGVPDEFRQALAQLHVFPKRLGTAADFARLALHLVENPLINGEVVRLDAGARMPPR